MTPRPMAEALQRLLRPRTIAVVGGREAAEVVHQCDRLDFDGEVWPISHRRDSIAGRACFQRLEDLPGPPDASFIAIPAAPTVAAVAALAAMGAGGAVCYASGFKEAGAAGRDLQDRLVEAANGMPVMGPNCYGFINYLDGAALWPDQHGGQRTPRGVAIVTQSGNIGLNLTMQKRALPLAHLITLGNQAAIGIAECIEALLEDERITAIGLHIEGLGNLAGFERAAAVARAHGVPLVALKTGLSEAGAAIALSHTASLAGPDALYDALFDRLGVARARSIPDLLETLKLLSVVGPLAGNRLGSMSCSGGEASLIADLAEGRGIAFPAMTDTHRAAVAGTLNELVHVSNPLDYHTFIWGHADQLRATFTAMMAGDYDLTLLILDFPRSDRARQDDWWITAKAIVEAAHGRRRRAAVVASLPECLPEDVGAYLSENGIAPMQGMMEALSAVEAAVRVGRARARTPATSLLLAPPLSTTGDLVYDEWRSKRVLAAHGVVVPEGALVSSPGEAIAAAEALGWPVAIKAVSTETAHKTEAGAVALNLHDSATVAATADRIHAIAGRLLVERMITDGVAELIVGIDRDPQFGPYLLVGFGGVLVELVSDSRILLLPTDREAVVAALKSLKTAPVLDGYRGRPRADFGAAVDAILAIAAFAVEQANSVLELDVNPLIVRPEGSGAVAADALIRVAAPNQGGT